MKKVRFAKTVVFSVIVWTLTGAGVGAQNTPNTPTRPNNQTQPSQAAPTKQTDTPKTANANSGYPVSGADQKFLEEVSSGNLAEVQEAQLALQKSSDSEVKRLAQMIIRDHQKAQQEVQQLAQAHNLTLPMEPNALQKASYTKLSKLSGAAFDKKYVAAQIQEHTNTINTFHMITEVGNNLEVKQFAKKTIPALATHAEGFRQVARRMGIPSTFGRPDSSELARGMSATKSASNASMKNKPRTTANPTKP